MIISLHFLKGLSFVTCSFSEYSKLSSFVKLQVTLHTLVDDPSTLFDGEGLVVNSVGLTLTAHIQSITHYCLCIIISSSSQLLS